MAKKGRWGGRRDGSGRKPPDPHKPRVVAVPKLRQDVPQIAGPITTVPAEPKKSMMFDAAAWASLLPQIEELSRRYAVNKSEQARKWELPKFPEKAIPSNPEHQLAMDSELKEVISYGNAASYGSGFGAVAGEGLLFLGYTYLAELAQRPEYRVMSETIADDSTRKWIDFDITGDKKQNEEEAAKDPEGFAERMADPDERKKRVQDAGKLDRIKELKDDQLRLGVQQAFYQSSRTDNFFGRSHLFLDIRTTPHDDPSPNAAEIITDVGDASFGNETSRTKVPVGSFKGIRIIEPMWAYPILYNANDPLRADWYNPQQWYVMGKEIHQSRLLTFVGHPVPDILKPAYAFGGLALTQMVKPYVDIWLQTRQSVAEMIKAFSVMVLQTDLSQIMEPGGQAALMARIALFNIFRDNQGLFVTNKETEDFKNVSAALSGLDHLQAQAQEHMASVSRIPLVKLTGISPSGLNATSEFEIEVYDDSIEGYQERFHMPKLQRVVNFEMLSLWGEIDPEITIRFNPLRQVSQAELGAKLKDEADTREKYVNMGAFSPAEVRKIAIEDEDLPFGDLDPEELPPPPAEEGLLSGKGGKGGEQGQGGFGAGEGGEEDGGEDKSGDYGAGDSSITMDELREEMRTIIREAMAHDAVEWKETQHKRDDGGKFTSGGGGGGGAGSGKAGEMPPEGPSFLQTAQAPKTNIGAPLDLNTLQKVGAQMGSNPGGVYQSADGKKFYVKQGKTPAHVTNELVAGALYHLAGTPTLKYRPVDGGKHIATEMTQLDKNNANKFDEKQRAEAKKDFAVHAWLGNWDAAGTGGDNLGIVRGKPTALDVGGALEFRAQGAPKGKAFGDKVTELGTMRDKHMSPDNAKLFGDMTPAEMRESASFVTSIPDKEIKRTVEKLGGSPELAQKLIARRNDIAKQAESFGSDADPVSPDSAVVFAKDGKLPVSELNGVPFTPWEAPESTRDWANVEGQADIEEPEFIVPDRKRAGTGVVMREPDGRVWMMRPKNGFGGYQHTFPKGGLERGLSPQANAIKEAYEETGLKAKITGFAGDHEGDTSFTRYYFAEREAGDPSKTTWESDGVVLSPLSKLDGFLNRSRDKKIAASLGQDQAMDSSKEPEHELRIRYDGDFNMPKFIRHLHRLGAVGASRTITAQGEDDQEVPFGWDGDGADKIHEATIDGQNILTSGAEDEANFEEGKHPRGPDGKFTDGAGGGPSGSTLEGIAGELTKPDKDGGTELKKEAPYGGLYVTAHGDDKKANHDATVAKVVKGPVQLGIHYRRMLAQLLKEGPGFGMHEVAKGIVKDKLATSWAMAAENALKKGKQDEADKCLKKAMEYGFEGQVGSPAPAAKPAPTPAPATPGPPQNYAQFKQHLEDAVANKDADTFNGLMKYNPEWAKQIKTEMGAWAAVPPEPESKPEPKPEPKFEVPKFPPPTEAELAKAKKSVALQPQFLPGDKPEIAGGEPHKAAMALIQAFNKKYEGKNLADDPKALAGKVNDFKALAAGVNALAKAEQGDKAKVSAELQKKKAEEAAKKVAAAKEEAKKHNAATKEIMAELGLTEQHADGFYSLAEMMGATPSTMIANFKKYEQQAHGLGYPINGFQCALIKNYSNGGYLKINEAMRSGAWTPAQHVYASMVNQALLKMPKHTGKVNRNTSLTPEQLAGYKEGHVIQEHALTSTSTGNVFSGNVHFEIQAIGKRGAHIKKLSNHPGEDEVLFAAKTYFKVNKVEEKNGKTWIHMEEWDAPL